VPGLNLDLRMNADHAYFTDKLIGFGMRGDFRRDGTGSGLRVPVVIPVPTDRSMCFVLNQTLVQSFFEHAYDAGYFDLRQDVLKDDIPDAIKKDIYAFCPGLFDGCLEGNFSRTRVLNNKLIIANFLVFKLNPIKHLTILHRHM